MQKRQPRRASFPVSIEAMEPRRMMSATVTTISTPSTEILGQDFTITATVKTSLGAAVSSGSVNLFDDGTSTGLSAPLNSSGVATFTFGAGNALYTGSYSLSADYLGNSADDASASAAAPLTISLPAFVSEGNGLQVATVTPGSGAGAVSGQSLTVEYTGFLESNGGEFDESSAHSPPNLSYTLNATPEQVVPGFDDGTTGMEIGETRDIVIPSNLGYNDNQVRIYVVQSIQPGSPTVGPADRLTISSPTTAVVGQATSPAIVVNVDDANSNLVGTDSSTVTLAMVSGPAGGALSGTTSVAAASGVATFSSLSFTQPGTYTLLASDGSLSSIMSVPIVVTTLPVSAVVPSLGKVSLPGAVVAGAKIAAKVPVVISNKGAAASGDFTVKIYADTASTLDGNQVLVATSTKKLKLKANATHTFNFNIKSLPSTLPDGTYHLIAEMIDPSSAGNIVATTQTIMVAAAFVQPILSVGAVTPSAITSGKTGSLLVTITNQGNAPASGADLSLSPSTDGVTQLPGVILDTLDSGAKILPGKSKTFKLHFKTVSTLEAGSYFPYVALTLDGVAASKVGTSQFTVS